MPLPNITPPQGSKLRRSTRETVDQTRALAAKIEGGGLESDMTRGPDQLNTSKGLPE
jgi:hypothetical protein